MNFRDDRKQVFCDSFGSQSSNATSIHSVLNMCMTVPNIVRNMKILPTYGQCIPSHTEIILKLSQSAVCITGITKFIMKWNGESLICFSQRLGFRMQNQNRFSGRENHWAESWRMKKIEQKIKKKSLLGRGSTMGKGIEEWELMLHWEIKH